MTVTVDGGQIDDSKYVVDQSGKVKLTDESTNSLKNGSHKIVVTYDDGSTTTIDLEVTNSNNQTTTTSTSSAVVATGESSPYITLAGVLSLIAILAFAFRKRFKSESDN